ncbi:helix-turn-helix domain-containing protein [Nannocystaceae bacterium ST9]
MSVRANNVGEDVRHATPVTVPASQREALRGLAQVLEFDSKTRKPSRPRIVGPDGRSVELPDTVFHLFVRVVEVLARGDAVTVVPVGKQLTTQQAANILNVSRQYLVRLLDEGRIPFTKTGTHRRVKIEDVLEFKRVRDDERRAGLDELTALSEEFGGYSELE